MFNLSLDKFLDGEVLGQEAHRVIILIHDARLSYREHLFPYALPSRKIITLLNLSNLLIEKKFFAFNVHLFLVRLGSFSHFYFLFGILLPTGSFPSSSLFLGICLFLLKVGEQTLSPGLTFAF